MFLNRHFLIFLACFLASSPLFNCGPVDQNELKENEYEGLLTKERDRYSPKNHGPIPRRPTRDTAFDVVPSPDAAKELEEPEENGCKGLEGGKKYLVSDNGGMLARCLNCGPSFDSLQSVGVHGKRGDVFAQWTFEPVGDKCAIKSDIGAYAGRCSGCWEEGAYPDSVFNHLETASPEFPNSLWEVEKHGDSYSFKADTGEYMARCRGCVTGGAKEDFAFVHATSPTGPAVWGVLSDQQST